MEYCSLLILVDGGVNDSAVVNSRTESEREWLENQGYVWNQYIIWCNGMWRSSICRGGGRLTLNEHVYWQRMILESQQFHQPRSVLVIGYNAKRLLAQKPNYSRQWKASGSPSLLLRELHSLGMLRTYSFSSNCSEEDAFEVSIPASGFCNLLVCPPKEPSTHRRN